MSVTERLLTSIQTTLSDARAAAAIGAGTTGFSLAQALGWLQANIGFMGALAGIVLTSVTIWVQVVNGRRAMQEHEFDEERRALDRQKRQLEIELLRRRLDEQDK